MRLFEFFCSEFLATVNIQIPLIVFVVQNQVSLATAVQWQRETNPVVFGNNVTLTCMVGRTEGCDNTVTRRWDVGPNRNILLLNGHSTNSSKYFEISEEPCKYFSLVIMQFDINDVNWEYWCSFGFETSRQMLMLDDLHFIGLPTNTDIFYSLEHNVQRELDLKITFYKLYPKPKCKIKIEDTKWITVSVNVNLESNHTGIFLNSIVQYKTSFHESQCNCNVTISCSLLSYIILQLNKRLNCTDAVVKHREKNYSMVITSVLVIFAFITIGFAGFMLIKKISEVRQENTLSNQVELLRLDENKDETQPLNSQ